MIQISSAAGLRYNLCPFMKIRDGLNRCTLSVSEPIRPLLTYSLFAKIKLLCHQLQSLTQFLVPQQSMTHVIKPNEFHTMRYTAKCHICHIGLYHGHQVTNEALGPLEMKPVTGAAAETKWCYSC